MATQQTVTEYYWGWCYWHGIPYLCRKSRQVTKWCYHFSWIEVHCIFFVGWNIACENGIKYKWVYPVFNLYGNAQYRDVTWCFNNQLNKIGTC